MIFFYREAFQDIIIKGEAATKIIFWGVLQKYVKNILGKITFFICCMGEVVQIVQIVEFFVQFCDNRTFLFLAKTNNIFGPC